MAPGGVSRPETRALRLFVAVEIPPHIRRALADTVTPVRERFPKARWVPVDNQHVTLKFLGSTWPRLLEWVTASIADVAGSFEPFRTRAVGLGGFPNSRRARVLWAGLDDPGSRFARLARSLDDALAREFTSDERAFTPHLTLARFDPPATLGQLAAPVRSEPFEVDRLALFRSHLRRPAPVYELLAALPLGG